MRADRIPVGSPDAPAGTPEAPDHLDEFGREGWSRISAAVARLGLSSPVDADSMRIYAEAYSRGRRAWDDMDKRGLTIETSRGETTNPAVGIAERAERTQLSVLSLFGLNPSDRGRLRATDGPAEDEFERFKRENA
jgi:P27 family predicted phage terminase small subunit